MNKTWSGHIEVGVVEEHEDGSATVSVTCDKSFSVFIFDLGFNFLMACAASGITHDEAYERILANDG